MKEMYYFLDKCGVNKTSLEKYGGGAVQLTRL